MTALPEEQRGVQATLDPDKLMRGRNFQAKSSQKRGDSSGESAPL